MCGICGIAEASGATAPPRLAAMSATLDHRGPDVEGSDVEGSVGLAARRRSLIDLETGTLARLRGMLALALWDGRGRRLPLARDRFGIKPLCFGARAGGLRVATAIGLARVHPRHERHVERMPGNVRAPEVLDER